MGKKTRGRPENLFVRYWLPLILYALALFIQSAFPSPEGLPSFPHSDKVMHFIAYAIMGGLFFRAFISTFPRWMLARLILFSILLTAAYGVGDEIHQMFVPSRTADVFDVAADMVGGMVGAFCYYLIPRKEIHP